MRYLLLSPHKLLVSANAGWNFITAGIGHLINLADKDSVLETFDGFGNQEWPKAEFFSKFDWVVICGNPRYDLIDHEDKWLYEGMFEKLRDMQKIAPFKVLDAWQGSGAPLGLTNAQAIAALKEKPRNMKIRDLLLEMKARVITRDAITQQVNKGWNVPSIQLPCSSYFGAEHFMLLHGPSIEISDKKRQVVIAKDMDGYDGGKAILRTLARSHEIVATNSHDAEYCARSNIRHVTIFAPNDLCQLFMECAEIISFRLHILIPAARFARVTGARLFYSAIDTRGETCRAFGIPFEDYREGVIKTAAPTTVQAPVEDLKAILGI